jgi:hypothetical protein
LVYDVAVLCEETREDVEVRFEIVHNENAAGRRTHAAESGEESQQYVKITKIACAKRHTESHGLPEASNPLARNLVCARKELA